MKKFIATLMVTLGVAALYADDNDSYLWWWVADTENGWATASWQDARIKATDGNTTSYLTIYGHETETVGGYAGVEDAGTGNAGSTTESWYGALVTSCSGNSWTYFLEVFNGDTWVGRSDALSYSQAANYISTGGTSFPEGIWDFGQMGFTAAPEPNSAMLLLLGLSALALRRKQKKA